MTDKELIKQEIERLKEHTAKCGYPGQGEFENGNREGRNWVCEKLLQFIDSLPEEPASEDLEEYYKKEFLPNEWFAKPGQRTLSEFIFFTAKHFAEWQKRKDQETIELAEDHAMLAGMEKMREEMMKNAVDGWCSSGGNLYNDIRILDTEKANLKMNDKVKIIIVKEDKQ